MSYPTLIFTPGEPAGIGPDLILKVAQQPLEAAVVVCADKNMLRERAELLNLPVTFHKYEKAITLLIA
mgnify:FL=1